MFKNNTILIISLFFLLSCGYSTIHSQNKNLNFTLTGLELNGDRETNNFIKSRLKKFLNNESEKNFILCKWPFISRGYNTTTDSVTKNNFFINSYYNNYIKIFIIRNPLFVFSSLNKRYSYKIPSNHSIDVYIYTKYEYE